MDALLKGPGKRKGHWVNSNPWKYEIATPFRLAITVILDVLIYDTSMNETLDSVLVSVQVNPGRVNILPLR